MNTHFFRSPLRLLFFAGVCSVLSFIIAPTAFAGGTYYVKPTGDDNKNCLTVATACKTVNGAITKLSDQINPKNSTIILNAGTYDYFSVYSSTDELDGLTIKTAAGQGRATINAVGESTAISISGIDNVVLQNLNILNFESYGIYAGGGSDDYINGLSIKNSVIHSPAASDQTKFGLYLFYVDNLLFQRSTVRDMTPTIADDTTSHSIYGLYQYGGNGGKIIQSTFSNLRPRVNRSTDSTGLSTNTYGLSLNKVSNVDIKQNTFINIGPTLSVNADDSDVTANIYGASISSSNGITMSKNILRRIDGSVTTQGASSASVYAIPLYFSIVGDGRIVGNTLTGGNIRVSASGIDELANGASYGIETFGLNNIDILKNHVHTNAVIGKNNGGYLSNYGIYINATDGSNVYQNTISNNTATNEGNIGSASSYGILVRGGGEMDIYKNRVNNFIATGNADSTNESVGIHLGYRAKANVFNNLVYMIDPPNSEDVYGLRVHSRQATPLYIYHNTLNNISVCLEIRAMEELEFMNNVCRVNHSGGYGIEVNGDDMDLTNMKSNFNVFVNSRGPLRFNDVDEGTMGLKQWRGAGYEFDKNSRESAVLIIDSKHKKYLHTKKKSAARKRGKKGLTFKGDEEATALLKYDFVGKRRDSKKIQNKNKKVRKKNKKVRKQLKNKRKLIRPTIGAFQK